MQGGLSSQFSIIIFCFPEKNTVIPNTCFVKKFMTKAILHHA